MLFRQIGDTGLDSSIIGLGTGRLASVSGGLSPAKAIELIAAAADCGINLIDTADSYAQGQCEKMIAPAIRARRSQFIIVTKAGYTFSSLGGGLRLLKPIAKKILKYFKGGKNLAGNVRANVSRQDFSPVAIRNSVIASLQRLETDYLDIFLLHSPTPAAVENPELWELLRRLKSEGKIRHFGVSTPEPAVMETILKIKDVSVVETPISPAQSASSNLFSRLADAKKGIIANQIFLSGKLIGTDNAEPSAIKDQLSQLAAARGISTHELLLKFALAQPGVATVLSGTTNVAHLKQNVADALTPHVLSAEDVIAINRLRATS